MATDLQPQHSTRTTLRRLIVRVSTQTLAFSTADSDGQVDYRQYPMKSGMSVAANLREALRTEPMLAADYGRVVAMIDGPVLMMPVDEFRADEADELYHHAFTLAGQLTVMHHVMPELNAVALFGMQKDLCTVMADRFGEVRYMPVSAPVWRHLQQRSYTGPRQKLYGYFHDQRMEVFAFAQNRFVFCNTYDVQDSDDALYFLLAVWKQVGLTAEADELHLVGSLPQGEQLLEQARTFIKRVYHILPAGEFNRAQVTQLEGVPYDVIVYYMRMF